MVDIMDKKLVKFLEEAYQTATMCNDYFDARSYAYQAVGACCYEYERSGDMDAINIWRNEWREKFEKIILDK